MALITPASITSPGRRKQRRKKKQEEVDERVKEINKEG
jgi:hypothetical protein